MANPSDKFAGKQLYVGCGLTLASEEFKADVKTTKQKLRDLYDWDVMEFLGLTAGSNEDVYQTDILENVATCSAFVGILDEPSFGLGWEFRDATILKKPSLALAHVGSKITRLALGAPAFNPTMRFRRYENMVEDVPAIVAEEFEVVCDVIRLRQFAKTSAT